MSYMDVLVKHNGDDITQYVDNYTRQQKICTGIGTLEISFVSTISDTFEPWDIIELYEEGNKKGHYYIDIASISTPNSLITLSCRDGSKKLMDYFIAESYYIDYPSYNKYWIEKFLDAAQVDYVFNVDTSGTLLSNNTSLGLATAYDQIIPLLQMSGWYIHFDSDGKAVVGKLQTSLDSPSLSLDKTEILNIKVSKNDKMLRNRVIVWGGIDEITSLPVSAEAVTHTPWNYDDEDVRTSVISNSSIPDNDTAANIANMALSEFAQITVEKSLECAGGKDVYIGDFVSINSDVFTGVGLVTTIGSTLSKEGFKTNMVLDERCPRLFAFFDFGDLVYVSTMGEGVWRKYLDSDPTWYQYSIGIGDNSKITDLDKNNGILSCVTISGQAFFSIETSATWYPINIPSLDTIMPDASGVLLPELSTYSGGYATKAVTHDRITNTIKLAVSANTSDNYVDYTTGYSTLSSGIIPRSWIVTFNTGSEAVEDICPIHLGDFYSWDVFDIENDGAFDYVTVATSGFVTARLNKNVISGVSEGTQQQPIEDNTVSYVSLGTPFLDYDTLVSNTLDPSGAVTLCTYDTAAIKGVVGVFVDHHINKKFISGRFIDPLTFVFNESFDVQIPMNFSVVGIHQLTQYEYTILSRIGTNSYEFGTIRFHDGSYTTESSFIIEGSVQFADNQPNSRLVSFRTGPHLWGIKIIRSNVSSLVYGLKVDMRTSEYTETLILDCEGTEGNPVRVSPNATITPLNSGGILAKVARLEMEANQFHFVTSSRLSIVNFYGPEFLKTEQEKVIPSIELNRWQAQDIAIGIGMVANAANSSAHMAWAYASTYFQHDTLSIRSVFPFNTEYETKYGAISHVIGDTHVGYVTIWNSGPTFSETLLGQDGSLFGVYSFYTGNKIYDFPIPAGLVGNNFLPHPDSFSNNIYIFATPRVRLPGNSYLQKYLLEYSDTGAFQRSILLSLPGRTEIPDGTAFQNAANWIVLETGTNDGFLLYLTVFVTEIMPIAYYNILRREESDFTVIKTDVLNMRLDDSTGMPLVSVDDILKTTSLMRNYVTSGVSYQFSNILSEGTLEKQIVNDFRYTSTGITAPSGVVPPSGITVGSGIAGNNFVYAAMDGLNTIPMGDSLDLSENQIIFALEADVPYRVETTNYKLPNQRIFTVTSGEAGNRFFQSDPNPDPLVAAFAEYTVGFPQTLVTRIRVDDRL